MFFQLTSLARRALARAARRDRGDRFRSLFIVAHRLMPGGDEGDGDQAPSVVSGRMSPAGARSLADVVISTLPRQEDGILLLGDAAAAERLRQAGYVRVRSVPVPDGLSSGDVAGLVAALEGFEDGEFEVSAVSIALASLPAETLFAVLRELVRITRRWIAPTLAIYPEALAGRRRPGRLERQDWWDRHFRALGFAPAALPQDARAVERVVLYERSDAECGLGGDERRTTNDERRRRLDRESSLVVGRLSFVAPPPATRNPLAVHFAVDVAAGNSFTWVSVEFARALEQDGHRVSWVASEITETLPEGERARVRRWMAESRGDVHLKWAHYWPQFARMPLEGRRNFEQFAINHRYRRTAADEWDAWMRLIRESRSTFLPLSRFCQEALVAAGVPPERCPVLPLGYSPEIDRVSDAAFLPVQRGYRFLATTNSGDWRRYGTDLLLEAFARAFRTGDDVCLVLRDYGGDAYLASGDPHQLAARIEAVRERGLEVFYFARFLSKEEMVRFQRACHAFVAPFRGEGFGVKVLDAMACDLPAILPLYSGPADFCDAETCFPVPFHEVPMTEGLDAQNLRIGNDPAWCEVDVDALAATMQVVACDPEGAQERGRKSGLRVRRDYSWAAVCRRFEEIAR